MNQNNLLASVALFSELYNNEKYTNIYDIIAEFIKGAVVTEKQWVLNSTELTQLLNEVYDFNIPESVIRTTVRNRLRKIVTMTKDGYYAFDPKIADEFVKLNLEFQQMSEIQDRIISELIRFIESHEGNKFDISQRDIVVENFNKYLLDSGESDIYSKYISAFLIQHQENKSFKDNLNLVREGVILYQGIRYTADLNELGKWNSDLKIFLSTEHLFSALGYNGVLFRDIFDDFYNLVTEINHSNKNKYGEKRIELRFLEETQEEVDSFFKTAELIHRGSVTLDPLRPAMKMILDGCQNISDIKAKKIRFELDLKQKGIVLQKFNQSVYDHSEYNVEDENVIERIKEESLYKGKTLDEELCRRILKIFTKINYFRGGRSKTKFENIGHIFLTGQRFALYLAHNTKVKFGEDDIPFAKDIDYITNKFWFKLKKGFSNKQTLPKSFDVVTKAQLVLSSHVNHALSIEYNKLKKEFREGLLTKEEALERSYELREKPNMPEDFTVANLENSLEFLNTNSYFENLFRERERKETLYNEAIQQNKLLSQEIEKRDNLQRQADHVLNMTLFETKKNDYMISEWHEKTVLYRKDFIYFMVVLLVTIFPVFAGFVLKADENLNTWISNLGNGQYWVWGGLTALFLCELVGRSYLFNKDRFRNGWEWLLANLSKRKYDSVKDKDITIFEGEFMAANKYPTLEGHEEHLYHKEFNKF